MTVVTDGAEVFIVAGHAIEFVDTAVHGMAPVGSADIAVVAIELLPAVALAAAACVAGGADIAVIAGLIVDEGDAAFGGVAGVGGTGIAIFAFQGYSGHASLKGMAAFEAVARIVVGGAFEGSSSDAA